MKKLRYMLLIVLCVAAYLAAHYCFDLPDNFSDIIDTVLAIIAAVTFWIELQSNEAVNQAQLIAELNNQFISNPELTKVEWRLEQYYAEYQERIHRKKPTKTIPFHLTCDLEDLERQHLINYLVHLEGIAALVNDGVLRLSAITDLMAYRYFIAVNNPVVQKNELLPYINYYQGCYKIYRKWQRKLGRKKVPMAENNFRKKAKEHMKLQKKEAKHNAQAQKSPPTPDRTHPGT